MPQDNFQNLYVYQIRSRQALVNFGEHLHAIIINDSIWLSPHNSNCVHNRYINISHPAATELAPFIAASQA